MGKDKNTRSTWFYQDGNTTTPISTTHESLEMGRKLQAKIRIVARKQLNFQSYPMNDARLDSTQEELKRKGPEALSSYTRDYAAPNAPICKSKFENMKIKETPDIQFNRKPVNIFEFHPWSIEKFMDDQLTNITEQRRKANFFRQLRNAHYPLTE